MTHRSVEQEPPLGPGRPMPPAEPRTSPRPWWQGRWRSLVPWIAGTLAGTLVGAGAMAWHAGRLPWQEEDLCWGAVSRTDAQTLLNAQDVRSREIAPRLHGDVYGLCELAGGAGRVQIRVHEPGFRRGIGPAPDPMAWVHDWVRPGMTAWRDGDTIGMASGTEAWQTLPPSCVNDRTGPAVIDLVASRHPADRDTGDGDGGRRDLLARAAAGVLHATLEELGCDPVSTEPPDLADPPEPRPLDPARLCGVRGLEVPDSEVEGLGPTQERITTGDEAGIRSCAADSEYSPYYRLTTITAPALLNMLSDPQVIRGDGVSIEHATGEGVLNPLRAYVRVPCPDPEGDVRDREVLLMAEYEFGYHPEHVASLLPGYATAESDRLGCGPVDLDMPDLPEPQQR